MNVLIDARSLEAIKDAITNRKSDAPDTIRIYIAGIG